VTEDERDRLWAQQCDFPPEHLARVWLVPSEHFGLEAVHFSKVEAGVVSDRARAYVSRATLDAAVADVRHEESRLRARALRYLNVVLSGTRTDEFPALRHVERLLMNDNEHPEREGQDP
jgi:hypothetical protein